MNSPKNLTELIKYLQISHEIWSVDQGGSRRLLTFATHRRGGLWFVDQFGQDVYLPINCGLTNAETEIEFFEDRFEFTKFGVTLQYFYK